MAIPILALASVALAVTGQLALKTGMNRVGRVGVSGRPQWRKGLSSLSWGFSLYSASAVIWLFILSRAELSYAFPFMSLAYVFILIVARWRLKETIDASRLLGSALIVAGVLLVTLS